MKIFESILDNEEAVRSSVSSADLLPSDYEFPSLANHPHMLMLANGSDNYDDIISPEVMTERFNRLLDALQSFRHIKSCSDFGLYILKEDYYKSMPYFVRPTDEKNYQPGFFVSYLGDFRSLKDAVRFVYILNKIATGGTSGSITIFSREGKKLFVDYEQIDWVAEYNGLSFATPRAHNAFYSENTIRRLSRDVYLISNLSF